MRRILLTATAYLLMLSPCTDSTAQRPPHRPPPARPGLETPRFEPPKIDFAQATVQRPKTKEEVEALAVASLQDDVRQQFEHYASQAKTYDTLLLLLRLTAFACSLGAAIALVFGSSERAKRTALILSILGAAVPAADQIFQVSSMNRSSWRTTIDLSRLHVRCKTAIDASMLIAQSSAPATSILDIVNSCRADFNKIIDMDMEVSLKPSELNTKIEGR